MESFYTVGNFRFFAAALAFLVAGSVLAVLPAFHRRPFLLKCAVWSLIASAAVSAPARVCPYPVAAGLLGTAGRVLGAVGLLAGGYSSIRLLLSRNKKESAAAFADPDRAVTDFLAGHYLVIDRLGGVLAGTIDCLDDAAAEPNGDFFAFISDLFRGFPGTREHRDLRERFRRLDAAEGDLVSDDRFLRCSLTALGNDEGYLFYVQDFSEEHRLLRQRDEREHLMKQRLEQIRIQGEAETRALLTREASRVAEGYTGMISAGLEELLAEIDASRAAGEDVPGQIGKALERAERTMTDLRAAVHEMPAGKEAKV